MKLTYATLANNTGIAVHIVVTDHQADFPYVMERREKAGGKWHRVDAYPFLHVAIPAASKLFCALTTGQAF
jgi:hypothetical protein